MPKNNILPENGTIDLNNQNETKDVPADSSIEIVAQPEQELVVQNSQDKTTEVVTQDETPQEVIPVDELQPDDGAGGPNENNNTNETGRASKNVIAVASIVAGLIVITVGYITYRYFNGGNSESSTPPVANIQINTDNSEDYTGIVDDLNGRIGTGASTSRAEEWENPGDSDGIVMINTSSDSQSNSVQVTSSPQVVAQDPSTTTPNTAVVKQVTTATGSTQMNNSNSAWHANNYSKGDIKAGPYNVIRGDTLWEIAEAVYGNGSNWRRIAQANNVSYLANGHPLIIPGQVLNIPN